MSEVRILHAADLHLDSPFEALGSTLAAQRRREQRALLQSLPRLAQAHGAQLILLPGDLLDSDSAYPETARALAEAFAETQAEVFISPGNHDFYSAHAPYARIAFPKNVHIFRSNRLEPVALPELHARVWGAAFTDRRSEALLRGFSLRRQDTDTVELLCVHGEVGNPASPYNPIAEEELAASGFDYVALGHTHRFGGLRRAGNTSYAWPGCAEGRGFDETGEKGALLVDVRPGGAQAEFIPLGGRRYEILRVPAGEDAARAVLEALPAGAERNIFRVILTGETDRAPDTALVRAALAGRVFAAEVRDETRLRQDIWAQAGESTLRGLFLAALKERLDAAETAEARAAVTQAARWGLAALDHDEEVATL